jgi:ParB/RepB/Spo0J family partition protein
MNPSDTTAGESPGPLRKTCPKCGVDLLASAFARNATSADGLQSTCRDCQRSYRASWALANKDRLRNERAARRIPEPTAPAAVAALPVAERPVETSAQDVSGFDLEASRRRAAEAPTRMAELPLTAIVASLTNPRKHFNADQLDLLAASIRKQGLAHPILVRPLPGSRLQETYSDRRADAPRPTHEVVAGERRWRACDIAVLELQLVENLMRSDLHPMEEAEGYERLRRDFGLTPDQIGERIDKGKSYVYNTLQLLDLEPEAREAFYAGKLSRSTAELVSKRPPNLQIQLLKEITAPDFHGEPMSFRKAKAYVEDRYMLRLADAPFNTRDALLLPIAGACPPCPKRTGANPELFEDVSNRDTCTDTHCFAQKKAAHYERVRADAEAKGLTVVVGKEAREIMPTSTTLRGYVKVDDPQALNGQMRTLRQVMGNDLPAVTLVEDPTTHAMVAVLPTTVVGELLRKHSIARASPAPSAEDTQRELLQRFERTWRARAVESVFTEAEKRICGIGPVVMRLLALMLLEGLPRDQRHHVCKLLNIGTVADQEGIAEAINDCEPGRLEALLLLLFMEHDLGSMVTVGTQAKSPLRIEAVAADLEVDLQALRAKVRSEMAEAIKPPVLAKPARKGKTTAVEAQAAIAQQLQELEAGGAQT